MHVVGNRPQFIKLAPVSRELRKRGHEDIIIHTGQHFDENMSDVFFEEMQIPKPDENLHVSGGTHAQMTANMMVALEPVFLKYKPDNVFADRVFVENSTKGVGLLEKYQKRVITTYE